MSPTKVDGARHVTLLAGIFIALIGLTQPIRFDRLYEFSISEHPWLTFRIAFWISISAYALFSKNFAAVAVMGFSLIGFCSGILFQIFSYNNSSGWFSQLIDGVDRPGVGLLYLFAGGLLLLIASLNPLWSSIKREFESQGR